MTINKAWHLINKMPKNPTFAERVSWHLRHVQHCSCRKIPKKMAAQMDDAGICYPNDKVDQ